MRSCPDTDIDPIDVRGRGAGGKRDLLVVTEREGWQYLI